MDEVVDEASVMEVADSSAYNSFARQPIRLPRERAARSGRFRMARYNSLDNNRGCGVGEGVESVVSA